MVKSFNDYLVLHNKLKTPKTNLALALTMPGLLLAESVVADTQERVKSGMNLEECRHIFEAEPRADSTYVNTDGSLTTEFRNSFANGEYWWLYLTRYENGKKDYVCGVEEIIALS